jgi:cyanophycinase-like exopeptidase
MFVLLMTLSTAAVSLSVAGERPSYDYYLTGDAADVDTETSPGLLLAGGSTDVDAAMAWMIAKSGGGDFVVIRCSGEDGYNDWLYTDIGGVDSVETIVFNTEEACSDRFVLRTIRNAEALFIAGGNQWDYVRMWKGTQVEKAIHFVRDRGVPIGGTSAGLAVLGEFVYAAQKGSVDSVAALRDPYTERVTLETDFLEMPNMGGKITDSHFAARDRMGRLVTFLARIVQDGWAAQASGIGVDEETALGVDPDGTVTLFTLSDTGSAYFLRTTRAPEVCEARTPLTFTGISVYKMSEGDSFNLATWSGTGGTEYSLSAVDGVLTSDQADGSIY